MFYRFRPYKKLILQTEYSYQSVIILFKSHKYGLLNNNKHIFYITIHCNKDRHSLVYLKLLSPKTIKPNINVRKMPN